LKAAYKEFYAIDENFKNREATPNHQFPTYFLIHRFVDESAGQRGGTQLIAESALKVSKVIKDNPSLLETLDESAKNFLAACVNQPVAGFSEIAVLAEIALQPEIPAKLEKAKILIAEELIKEEVRALGVGAGLEVELGNAMLREVHKNLLANHKITEPWPGIPEGVAYEASVRSYTTEENITEISKKVSEKLESLTQENVSEFLLEGRFQDFWASAIVAKERRDELKSPYSKAVEELLENPISHEELKKLETNCREKILEESRRLTELAQNLGAQNEAELSSETDSAAELKSSRPSLIEPLSTLFVPRRIKKTLTERKLAAAKNRSLIEETSNQPNQPSGVTERAQNSGVQNEAALSPENGSAASSGQSLTETPPPPRVGQRPSTDISTQGISTRRPAAPGDKGNKCCTIS